MKNLQLTQQELMEMVSELQSNCEGFINEKNADNRCSDLEKKSHELYWVGVSHGAKVLYDEILQTIKYKNLAVSE